MSYHQNIGVPALGTIVRANPLPVGRYWQDFFGDSRDKFATWLLQNSASVQAETTQSFDPTSDFPAHDFYIFNVKAPVPWDAVTFGFPTIADATVKSSDDTVQRPPPPKTGEETVTDAANAISKYAFWGVLAIGGLLAFRAVDALGLLAPRRS